MVVITYWVTLYYRQEFYQIWICVTRRDLIRTRECVPLFLDGYVLLITLLEFSVLCFFFFWCPRSVFWAKCSICLWIGGHSISLTFFFVNIILLWKLICNYTIKELWKLILYYLSKQISPDLFCDYNRESGPSNVYYLWNQFDV